MSQICLYISEEDPELVYEPTVEVENSKGQIKKVKKPNFLGCPTILDCFHNCKGFLLSFVSVEGSGKKLQMGGGARVHGMKRTVLQTIDIKPILEKYTGQEFSTLQDYNHYLIRCSRKHKDHYWSLREKDNTELTRLIMKQEKVLDKDQVKKMMSEEYCGYEVLW